MAALPYVKEEQREEWVRWFDLWVNESKRAREAQKKAGEMLKQLKAGCSKWPKQE